MSQLKDYQEALPENARKFLDPNLNKDQRLMGAQGVLGLPPMPTIVIARYYCDDADAEVSSAAKSTLLDFPAGVLVPLLKQFKLDSVLDFYAKEKLSDIVVMETIILNTFTADETLMSIAKVVPESLTALLANNQVRLIKNPNIAEALRTNPNMLRSNIDMMCSFLRINGIVLEGESSELTDAEIKEILAMEDSSISLPDELVDENFTEEISEERRKSIYQLVQTLNIAQKIKLALTGNKEARSLLIKDSNKIVCSSVIKSPKITDLEIMNIANMRSVHEEVIRLICIKPDWVRHYNVQMALCNNPKTPFPVALKFVRQLRVADLQKVSKNKNISSQLSKIATELFETKRK